MFITSVALVDDSVTGHHREGSNLYGTVNFFVFELPEGVPDDSEYWVFFFLERADKGEEYSLHLIVQSAYVGQRDRSPAGRTTKKITFRTLVSKVLAGEKPKPPP